jgi:hypothetical protein
MFEFISKHAKLVAIIAALIIIVLSIILIYLGSQKKTEVPNEVGTPDTNGLLIDTSNEYLTDDSISKEDKYLMLVAQTMTEEYGTNNLGDVRTLFDVQNQSTVGFSAKVQNMIDAIDSNKHIVTTVDPDSIKLNKVSSTRASVEMNATTEDKQTNQSSNITSTVSLVKQDTYWLVENIIFTNR